MFSIDNSKLPSYKAFFFGVSLESHRVNCAITIATVIGANQVFSWNNGSRKKTTAWLHEWLQHVADISLVLLVWAVWLSLELAILHLGWFTEKGPHKSQEYTVFPTFYQHFYDLWGPFLGCQPKCCPQGSPQFELTNPLHGQVPWRDGCRDQHLLVIPALITIYTCGCSPNLKLCLHIACKYFYVWGHGI